MVIVLNGERIESPSCFEELKVRQYERIFKEWDLELPVEKRDYFKLFQIFTGTSFTNFEDTPENEVTMWNAMRWYIEGEHKFAEIPKVLQITHEGITKTLLVPKKVESMSIGQNIMLKQVLMKCKYIDEGISEAIAIYLQPVFDEGKFDSDRVKEFKVSIEDMPVYLVRNLGFFLLRHALPNGSKPTNNLKKIRNSLAQSKEKILLRLQTFQGFNHLKT